MTATLRSGHSNEYPLDITPAGQNLLLMANGLDSMLRWNGLGSLADTAGVIAPTTAITFPNNQPPGLITATQGLTALVRFVDTEGNFSDPSPASALVTLTDQKMVYENVEVPTESKVEKRQIFRTLDGAAAVAFLDIETTDLTSTRFESDKTDDVLSSGIQLVLVDAVGDTPAFKFGVPPNHKAVVVSHRGRMFLAVEREYDRGSVVVTNGSTSVRGIGTSWTSAMKGREIYVVGAPRSYLIDQMDVSSQTIVLNETYGGVSDSFASYTVRSTGSERRTIYWSEPGLPESWPAENAFTVQETGDEITGAFSRGNFLYIVERNFIHRLTFNFSPADGEIFLVAYRGCINNRCTILGADEKIYMLDEQGVHAYDGGRTTAPISQQIQDLFRPESETRINWEASRWFHGIHYPAEETIRWFVALSGGRFPRHALCYQYRIQRWWIEEYPRTMASSTTGRIGLPRNFVGTSNGEIVAISVGTLDGAGPVGTIRGEVSAATIFSVSDTLAAFDSSVVGAMVSIVKGLGKGQEREIISISGTTLNLAYPWDILPDTTSVYQIGSPHWKYRTGWFQWLVEERQNPRSITTLWEPIETDGIFNIKIFTDRSKVADKMGLTDSIDGISTVEGDTDIEIDMTKNIGYTRQELGSSRERNTDGDRFVSFGLEGFAPKAKVRIHQLEVDGAFNA